MQPLCQPIQVQLFIYQYRKVISQLGLCSIIQEVEISDGEIQLIIDPKPVTKERGTKEPRMVKLLYGEEVIENTADEYRSYT